MKNIVFTRNVLFGIFLISLVLIGCNPVNTDQTDVIVIGGTPGGIAAAVAAARMGRTVTLIEYHDHIGGMMAGGLGKSDIEDRAMIGGIFKEYVDSVYAYYVETYGENHENVKLCRNGYYYEPSVAESILEEMLNEQQKINVMKGWRLESAQLINNRLTEVKIINRKSEKSQSIKARVFIDATYEGDLYAAAGADFRLGRESSDEYGEPHAGVIYYDYQEKKILPKTTGKADNRLPASTYRLCMTTDPNNAHILTEPPPEYDRRKYIGYFDDLKAGRLAGPKVFKPGRGYNPAHFNTLVRALSVTNIPNKKTDVNMNPRPLGFPFAEENQGYVEGDDSTRQNIRERIKNLTLGLLWFLQNDSEVPKQHRKLANELHLAKDEFRDNNNFPFQLYIREARRLVGEYTLTEKDITGDDNGTMPRHHYDNIAIGEFPIDNFPCRKRQPGDSIVLEGYLGMLDHITRPYEIPYRIMIPKQIDGLIVPVAASTSHVGFSSIRMEPTWMALGQAAGVAAAIAIEADVKPRNVPIKKLQKQLSQQGQVLQHSKDSTPHPEKNSQSSLMLNGPWVPDDPHKIDFNSLPRIKSQHAVVSDVRSFNGVNQHNYLVHHNGKYWIMWSDGPGVEDRVGQRVAFATSNDGLKWSSPKYITPYPPNSSPNSPNYNTRSDKGYRYISRGFWERGNELLALVSIDEADKFFGAGLELRAFRLNSKNETWEDIGLVYDNTINNFPPKMLPNGEWMMTRRSYKRDVYMLTGGIEGFDKWDSHPVVSHDESALMPEEPYWWVLPDGNLLALFRDNAKSGFLFRAFSTDNGRTWSKPVRTDFPDARSKFNGLKLSDGRYVLVSNPNPKKRDPLAISVSNDGIIFNEMAYLIGDRRVDYPHIIEHNGYLLIAFSGAKQSVEVLKFKISELNNLEKSPVKLPYKPILFIDNHVVEFIPNDKKVKTYYTTDGSTPTKNSKIYTKPFTISESTTINIVGITPKGKSGSVYKIEYVKKTPIEPIWVEEKKEGLRFDYFELHSAINSTTELLKRKPTASGSVQKFDIPIEDDKLLDNYGIIYNGLIEIPKNSIYIFSVLSNDGSRLYIADNLVVENDGTHGAVEKEGEIVLGAGLHIIKLLYFQAGGGETLKVFWQGTGLEKKEIPVSVLFQKND